MIGAVGFWGTFVVHRGEGLLWELLPGIAELDDAELCHDGVAGGWQVTRVFAGLERLPAGFLAAVRDATAAPVLAADVWDSDAALVSALGVRTAGWQAWLHLDRAIGHFVPHPSPFDDNGTYLGDGWRDPDYERDVAAVKGRIVAETPGGSAAAAAAIAWAAEAGLRPRGLAEVTEAFDGEEVFVEDLFFTLLNRLGLATEDVDAPTSPSIVEVLRTLFGRRLETVRLTAHQPVHGERLPFPGMSDLRLDFDDGSSVTACGCRGEFTLLPAQSRDASVEAGSHAHESVTHDVSEVAGRQLTGAATVCDRYLPDLTGLVLRLDGRVLFIAAIEGRWTVATGVTTPEHLIDAADLWANPWLR